MSIDTIDKFKIRRIHTDMVEIANAALQSLDTLNERNYLDTLHYIRQKIDTKMHHFNSRPYRDTK